MTVNLTTTEILIGAAALVALVLVWRVGARKAKRAADAARAGARGVSLTARVVVMAAAMSGTQWLAFAHSADTTLRIVLLALPDLIAAFVLTRALTVTDLGTKKRRGERQ